MKEKLPKEKIKTIKAKNDFQNYVLYKLQELENKFKMHDHLSRDKFVEPKSMKIEKLENGIWEFSFENYDGSRLSVKNYFDGMYKFLLGSYKYIAKIENITDDKENDADLS